MKKLRFDWQEVPELPPVVTVHPGEEERQFVLDKIRKMEPGEVMSKQYGSKRTASNHRRTLKKQLEKEGIRATIVTRRAAIYIKKQRNAKEKMD
jgi:hypothetical protein